jgi:predicted dehydrogenase
MSDQNNLPALPKIEQGLIRLGYVGCGFMAQNVHLPNFSSLNDCQLVALAENRRALGEEVARRYSIPKAYLDHRQLLDEDEVDAVAVSADYAQQGEIAADFLRAGKHVFMEKPMAVSVEQAERILQAAGQGKTRLMVGYMKRYDPGNRIVRRTIREWQQNRSKGKLLLARTHGFCGNWIAELDTSGMIRSAEPVKPVSSDALLPSWLPAKHRESYVAYLQQYTHNVNLLRFFLDIHRRDQVEVRNVDLNEDGYTGIVTLQLDGARCVIESGKTQFHSWEEHTQIYFEGGWVRTWPNPLFTRPSYCQVEIYEGGASASYQYPVPQPLSAWHYREEAAHFISCLKTGSPFDSSGEDALLDVAIFEEIYQRHLT